ncbi:hypothetical protein Lal_00036679 [Lupinus albus]|nr:hypothetical protein Lal_00036679 [Lupinus albus]
MEPARKLGELFSSLSFWMKLLLPIVVKRQYCFTFRFQEGDKDSLTSKKSQWIRITTISKLYLDII